MPEIKRIKENLLLRLGLLNNRATEIDNDLRLPQDDDFSENASESEGD